MRFLFVLVACVQITFGGFLSGGEKSPKTTFRVLIVFDQSASKLHRIDAFKIKKSFENIAWSIKAPIDLKMVERSRFSSRTVQKWSGRIRKTDIAIVYYSGPQAENPDYDGSWPSISLPSKHSVKIIPVIALSDTFLVSRPKLSLVIADCYDKEAKTDSALRCFLGRPFKKVRNPLHADKLRKMWLRTKGELILCSHARGEAGYGIILDHQYCGGVFTEAVLRGLSFSTLTAFSEDVSRTMLRLRKLMPDPQNVECMSSFKN
jgi:hypothetical protein